MSDIFKQAAKSGLRFDTPRGRISSEDLWQLPLEELDAVAIELSSQIDNTSTTSFINKDAGPSKALTLGFAIVKEVIEDRLDDIEKQQKASANRVKRQEILQLMSDAQKKEDGELSLDDLQKKLDELED